MTSASSRMKPSRSVVVVGRDQAWRLADCAVDVGDDAAGSAYDVVVVVVDPRFIAGDHSQWLDPPNKTYGGQGVENVVHGLTGYIG